MAATTSVRACGHVCWEASSRSDAVRGFCGWSSIQLANSIAKSASAPAEDPSDLSRGAIFARKAQNAALSTGFPAAAEAWVAEAVGELTGGEDVTDELAA
ncbi:MULTISPECIES: hypothetical protein [unclassified Streptomyces]|uniref:hypothetical protein n=1 Tax=unclassified Streptomyces TaxID=2593676 RepID=UPI002E2C9715|nr:hypothetical protein [Streptomyces sp. NBC_00223]